MIIFNKSVYNRACHILYTLHCVLYDVIIIMHILIKQDESQCVVLFSISVMSGVFYGWTGFPRSWKIMENHGK